MKGAWTSRCLSNWVVWLENTGTGWNAKVWRWPFNKPPSDRVQLDARTNMTSHEEAIKWACDVMKNDGATVMVLDAPGITLASMLKFTPAPQAVA